MVMVKVSYLNRNTGITLLAKNGQKIGLYYAQRATETPLVPCANGPLQELKLQNNGPCA